MFKFQMNILVLSYHLEDMGEQSLRRKGQHEDSAATETQPTQEKRVEEIHCNDTELLQIRI